MIKSSSDGIDRSGTSIPLGEYGDGWACTNACSFRSCDSQEAPSNGYEERSRPGTEIPQAREPICARIKATNSLARV